MPDIGFPVLWGGSEDQREAAGCPRLVPWEFVEPHEQRAQVNHSQTLNHLAQRGGLSPGELVVLVTDRPLWDVLGTSDVDWVPELLTLLEEHNG